VATVVSTPVRGELTARHLVDETAAIRAARMPVRPATTVVAAADSASGADLDLAVTAAEPAEPGLLEGIVGTIVSFLFN
jgi:hypothetical protein